MTRSSTRQHKESLGEVKSGDAIQGTECREPAGGRPWVGQKHKATRVPGIHENVGSQAPNGTGDKIRGKQPTVLLACGARRIGMCIARCAWQRTGGLHARKEGEDNPYSI